MNRWRKIGRASHKTIGGSAFLLLVLGWATVDRAGAQPKADDGKNSPQATVRSFLRAASFARESPKYIKAAIECLDLSGHPPERRNPGLLANHLEAILRARDVDTDSIPVKTEETTYVLPDTQGVRIALQRQPDGRWLFDRETVAQIPKMWTDIQKQLQDKNREAAALNISPDFASARATFRTFLKAHFRHDTATVLKCLDLQDVPAVARQEVGLQVANKLRQIILRYRLLIFQEMPDANYSDPYVWLSQPEGTIELVRRASGEHKGEWVFSRATVQSVDQLFGVFEGKPYLPEVAASNSAAIYPDPWQAPELWLRGFLSDWLKTEIGTLLGAHVQLYEVIGCLFVLALSFLITRLGTSGLFLVARHLLRLRGWEISLETLRRRLRPTGRFLGLACLRWGTLVLAVDRETLVLVLTLLNPLFLVLGMLALNGLIDLVGDLIEAHQTAGRRTTAVTQMLWPVASLVTKILLLLGTLFRLMSIFSWDVSTLLAGLGIGGLAFALGAQDSLKNLFGSFTLIADRPFVVGETVQIGTEGAGTVEFVGLRSTRIRTSDDTLLIVPNSNLTTMNIINYGRRRYRRYQTRIGIVYNTPLERVMTFRDRIREVIQQEQRTRKDHFEVAIIDLESSNIAILVDVYFEVPDRVQELEARDSLIVAILRLADELQIQPLAPAATNESRAKISHADFDEADLRQSA
jgi:MscS family membrane protein